MSFHCQISSKYSNSLDQRKKDKLGMNFIGWAMVENSFKLGRSPEKIMQIKIATTAPTCAMFGRTITDTK